MTLRRNLENVMCRPEYKQDCEGMVCDIEHYLEHANGTCLRNPTDYQHGPTVLRWNGQYGWRTGQLRPVPPSDMRRVSRLPLGDVAMRLMKEGT